VVGAVRDDLSGASYEFEDPADVGVVPVGIRVAPTIGRDGEGAVADPARTARRSVRGSARRFVQGVREKGDCDVFVTSGSIASASGPSRSGSPERSRRSVVDSQRTVLR
jgi:hypothetical protein